MVLFIHNRYRTTGGEERAVHDLARLVRERLGEEAHVLERHSGALARPRAAAALLAGGLDPGQVARAVAAAGARVLHAHNLQPTFGWRALAAARDAGARVVLHLHQYRLVCAIGVCFTHGEECTRCHGRNTLPGVRLNCRGSFAEALAYGASLAMWQRRMVAQADVVLVPSVFARERLRALGAPLDWERVRVLPPPVWAPQGHAGGQDGGAGGGRSQPRGYALVVSRLAREKGVDVAIEACRKAGIELVIAGEGPQRAELEALASEAPGVRFAGRVGDGELARLRAHAAVALAPSRSAETFGLAAAEAMAAGLPVAGSSAGALAELLEQDALAPAGDAQELARVIARLAGDARAGERARERVAAICGPDVVARGLAAAYAAAGA